MQIGEANIKTKDYPFSFTHLLQHKIKIIHFYLFFLWHEWPQIIWLLVFIRELCL